MLKIGLSVFLISFYLFVILTSVEASAGEREISSNFTWVIGESRDSVLKVHSDYEITGRLIHIKKLIKPQVNINYQPFCLNVIQDENERIQIFDFLVKINDTIVEQEGYIVSKWEGDSNIAKAHLPCVNLGRDDILEIDYFIGGKIKGAHENKSIALSIFQFFRLEPFEERLYPFDIYNFSSWSSLDTNFTMTYSAKVSIPTSYQFVNNVSWFSCPLLSKKALVGIYRNGTNNTSREKIIGRLASFSYIFSGYSTSREESFYLQSDYGSKESNIKSLGEVPCSPANEEVKWFITGFQNLTTSYDEVQDWRTGNFLFIQFGRPELIKALFWSSVILQASVVPFILWIYRKKSDRGINNAIISGFSIWAFQEGFNILSPIVRPLAITLFDMTLLVTLTIIILILIMTKITKKDKNNSNISSETIEKIKSSLDALPDFKKYLGEAFIEKLLASEERSKKHPIFLLLLYDFNNARKLSENLQILEKRCDKFQTILDRLTVSGDKYNFFSLLSEIDVMAHYYKKASNNFIVGYQPEIKEKGKKVDGKIIANGEEFYIEIFTIFMDETEQKIEELHEKIREKIDEIKNNPFNLSFRTQEGFSEEHLESFVEFVKKLLADLKSIKLDEIYEFKVGDKLLVSITFNKYSNLKEGTVVGMGGYARAYDDAGRLKNKILDKIEQIPENKKNIVIINLAYITSGFEEIEEVVEGQSVAQINVETKRGKWERLPNGIIHDSRGKNISLIIAYTKQNFENRRYYWIKSAKKPLSESELTIFN